MAVVKKFLDISDLGVVFDALRRHQYSGTNYKEFGLALGLLSSTLDAIAANNPSNVSNCLMDCLKEWLKKVDKVEEKGGPTWYTLIATLREIKENSVADGIDQEKHPACLIFSHYQADRSVVEILPQIVKFLYNEKIIGEMLPPTVEVQLLLKEVKQAVCADYQNLEKFATILHKFHINLSVGSAIMKEYAQIFSGNNAIEEMTPAHRERKNYQVHLKYGEFIKMREKFASTVYNACKAMAAIRIKNLKDYLRRGYNHLRPQLEQCQNRSAILDLICDECSLIDISLLESVADNFNITKAKSVICEYKKSIETFCKGKLHQYLNEKFSAGSCLLAETITFLVDRNIKECTLNDVRILIATAFNELSPNVKLVVIREGNSFIVTCSFPLILTELIIAAALENINLLKEKRVQRLTIGYCTVYNEQKEDKVNEAEKVHEYSEQQLKHFYTSVYTSKDTLEQITVSLNVQLMNSQAKNRTEEDEVQVITEKFIPFDTKESKDDEKGGVWSHETTLSCDVDYQKPKDYERSTKYTSDEIAEQNSPALTFEDIVKFGNTIEESDVQKLAAALKLGDYKVPEFSDKQKKITSILLKWEEVNKEMANKAALEKILDKYEIPYSFAPLEVEQKVTSSEEVSSLTGEAFEKEHVPIFSSPSSPSSELLISAHVFNDALSSLSSHVDRRQLLDFCLSLNIISKESHSMLLQSESMSFPLDPVFATSSKDLASFNNVMKVWNATETIAQKLQLATEYLNDVITDALIILLSFHISDPSLLKPLADCLGSDSLVPVPHESLPSVLFQILWDWRNKVLHANCRVLVEVLLQSEALPFNIAEFVISYTKSEHHCDYSISTLSHKKEHALSVMEVRHCFAQTYINIIEKIGKGRVANWLEITSDTNVHDFILKRCSWVNYDLLKELANNFNCNEAFDKYVKLHERHMADVRVFEIPSEFIPVIPATVPGHHFIQVILPQQLFSLFSGMVLYKIKSRLSKNLDIDEKHFLISGLQEAKLCITVAVDEQFLKGNTLEHLSILRDDQQFVPYDALYIGSSCHVSGSSVDVESNGYSYSFSAEAIDNYHSDFVCEKVSPLTSSTFDYKDDTKLSAIVGDVDIVADIDLAFVQGPSLRISMTEFKRIILNHKVPVALCLVAAMGLPYCGKTSLLEAVFKDNIKFKEGAKSKFEDYFNRKKDTNSLSVYELCVLGGKPQNQYSWSFATERYGAIFSILCGLVRHVALAKSDIRKVEFEQPQQHQEKARLVDEHFSWLMGKADKYLKEVIFEDTKKETLLLNGLTLVNVMDVGVNKALYDFLPIMLSLCRNHLRVVAFSLDRDGPKLHEVPDLSYDRYTEREDHQVIMKESSRLTHLLHFATLGCQQKKKEQEDSSRTIVIASSNDEPSGTTLSQFEEVKGKIQDEAKKKNVGHFFSNFVPVSTRNNSSLKKAKENVMNLIIDDKIYKKDLPLRWIFLRSLVISVRNKEIKIMIIKRRDIADIAVHQMGMDEEDLKNFLTTFTDFGSILYMPQFKALKDIVIVDIWEFMRYLNKLFYPEANESWYKNLVTYGFIKKKQAKEILKEYEEDFMKIIVTFGMAAYVSRGKVSLPGYALSEECYYLPSARTTKGFFPEHDGNNDYAFLEIESVTFPANVQASVTHEIMKKQNFYLIRSKCYNTTEFEFRLSSSHSSIQITMTDGGKKTKLAFHIKDSFNDMYWCMQACKGVFEACYDSLNRKTNQIRDLKYRIGVPCSATEGDNHYLYFGDISDVKNCHACSADDSFSCRKCWIEAAKTCEKLRKTGEVYDLTFTELSQVAQEVSRNNMISVLMKELKVDIPKSAKDYKYDRQAMEALMKWERKQHSPKPSLARILRRMGLTSVAESLQPPTT